MVTDVIQPLLDWIGQNPGWAWAAVFAFSLGECLVIFGLFLPGMVIMFSIGAVVATGKLDLLPTLLWAAAGAITGDQLSFWVGRHYQQRLPLIWPFRRYPKLLRRGMDFFYHHGGKGVFLSRFLGPVRPILPAVAGMMKMSIARFSVIDTISGLLWAPTYILPGVVFGASLRLAAEVAGRLAVLLTLVLIVLWFSLWLIRRLLRLVQPHTSAVFLRLLDWSRNHPRIRPLAGALLDPDHPEARGLLVLAGLWIVTSVLFALILTGVLGNAPLAGVDHYVFHLLQGLRTPWADEVMVRITELGDHFVRNCVFIAVLAWLAWTRHKSAAIHWLITYAAVAACTKGFKVFAHVPRPIDLYAGTSHFAFPSGHSSMSMTLYGFLAVLVAGELPAVRRWIPYGIAALLIVSIALSRLYLGAHWLTDAVGGIALGFGWVALLGVAYRRHSRPPIALSGLVIVAISTLIIAATWQGQRMFSTDLTQYAVSRSTQQVRQAAWEDSGWQQLPSYRWDLEGTKRHPITLQWSGDLKVVRQQLQANDWHRPASPRLRDGLHWLVPATPVDQLPILPQVHDGRYESLRMVQKDVTGQGWLIIRLWDSDFVITETNQPVWIGNVSRLDAYSRFQLISILRTDSDFNEPLTRFESTIERLIWKKKQRSENHRCDDRDLCAPVWDGTVLLLDSTGTDS